MSIFNKIFGSESEGHIKRTRALVERINFLEKEFEGFSESDIKSKVVELRQRVLGRAELESVMPEMFALIREAGKRTLGMRLFDVQLIGGAILHGGGIAEMKTGEGKTFVATLPAALNALAGEGVHVVSVNDYLSERDGVWMGQVYNYLGFSVGVIVSQTSYVYDPLHKELDSVRDETGSYRIVHEFLRPASRREAYECDIVYGTNSEFGFDYLRDNLEYEKSDVRQRKHSYAIVDEVDSILIDEARTPLIISAPSAESDEYYMRFASIANRLSEGEDYTISEKEHSVYITEEGISRVEKILGVENIYIEGGAKTIHHMETALKAKSLYRKDDHYVVKGDEVVIVDPYTGRMQPGRRWSDGLHQAIEAKEGLRIQRESRTYASITYQNYFRMYSKLSGMTGTALTSSEEFFKVYGVHTVAVPTNKPLARLDREDLIFKSETGKLAAIGKKVKELQTKGQPVLIGTISIEKNELVAEHLRLAGVRFEMLNAKNHEREGEIIAEAGRRGAVTIATNMAGRGVDIKLGGVPFDESRYEEVRGIGGLFVLGTERHDARRIDNQLRGRSGRQGDTGETQFFVSMEDNLMRVFASDTAKNMMGRLGIADDEPIQNRLISRSLETAQKKIEGLNFDSRKHILEYDDVLGHQRKIFYERRGKILMGDPAVALEHVEGIIKSALVAQGSSEALVAPISPESIDEENFKKKIAHLGEEPFGRLVRMVVLQTFDNFWVDHLEAMDYLRSSVNLRAVGQRDPLVEYKKEGLKLFKEMQTNMEHNILRIVSNINSVTEVKTNEQKQETIQSREAAYSSAGGGKTGRNDLCPCGSGKKFKKCHGK